MFFHFPPPEAYENSGIARDGAKMVNAVSCVDVACRQAQHGQGQGYRWRCEKQIACDSLHKVV